MSYSNICVLTIPNQLSTNDAEIPGPLIFGVLCHVTISPVTHPGTNLVSFSDCVITILQFHHHLGQVWRAVAPDNNRI